MRHAASVLLLLAAVPQMGAQTLRVFSEFRRIGPDGKVVSVDAHGKPREIISPAVPRNGFSSVRLAVTVPPGKPFVIHVGDNPEASFRYTLYKETDDVLEKVPLPYEGVAPADLRTQSYWLDMYVPRGFSPSRIRVEVQLNVQSHWVIYPMEVRVQAATIPPHAKPDSPLPPPGVNIVYTAFASMQAYLCGGPAPRAKLPEDLTARYLVRRNVGQDMALARSLEPALGKENLHHTLLELIGVSDAKSWCAARPQANSTYDPESYLKVRDYLLNAAVR